jgi:hypothetical protein
MSPHFRFPWGSLRIALITLLIMIFGTTSAVYAAPNSQIVREDGILGIFPGPLPNGRQVCNGGSLPLTFFVKNISPGMEVPLPVVEAGVTVTDDQGITKYILSNGAGMARFSWPTSKEGPLTLTVDATKTYYKPAQTLKLQVNVVNCQWALAIYFHEEYAILKEVSLVEGATTTWKGTLKSGQAQGENQISDISLEGGSGNYQFYVADQIQAPFHFSLYPPVSGDYNLNVKGTTDGSTVRLEFGTVPVSYPQIVTMKVTDYNPTMDIQVNYLPPAVTSNGNGMFLELNKLSTVTFPASGGAISLNSGMSCYFYTPDRTKYSLTIMLYPLKDMGAYLSNTTIYAEALP